MDGRTESGEYTYVPSWLKCVMDDSSNVRFIYNRSGYGFGTYSYDGKVKIKPHKIEDLLPIGLWESSYNHVVADHKGNLYAFLTTTYRHYSLDHYHYTKIGNDGKLLADIDIDLEFAIADMAIINEQLIVVGYSLSEKSRRREYFLLKFNSDGSKFKNYKIKSKVELNHSYNTAMFDLDKDRILLVSGYDYYYDHPKREKYINKTIIELRKNKIVVNENFPLADSAAILWPGIDLELNWNDRPKLKFGAADTLGYLSTLYDPGDHSETKNRKWAGLLFDKNGEVIRPDVVINGEIRRENLAEYKNGDIVAKYTYRDSNLISFPGLMIISFREFPDMILDYGDRN
jgi:hypothetical protein